MLNYSNLRDLQRKELESSAIAEVPEDFYVQIAELLSQRKQDAMSSQSLLVIKEYENIKKIVMSIQIKREEKIVHLALRGEQSASGLAVQEREMLKELSAIIKKSRDVVKNVWDSAGASSATTRRVRILKDISAYKGLDDQTYGPFREGDELSLPGAEAEWLLKSRMAEIV